MTLNECSTADDAITAALVQGLHAFMASEALVNANTTQSEQKRTYYISRALYYSQRLSQLASRAKISA